MAAHNANWRDAAAQPGPNESTLAYAACACRPTGCGPVPPRRMPQQLHYYQLPRFHPWPRYVTTWLIRHYTLHRSSTLQVVWSNIVKNNRVTKEFSSFPISHLLCLPCSRIVQFNGGPFHEKLVLVLFSLDAAIIKPRTEFRMGLNFLYRL